ncbi:MAG: NADH-ubiquinone oxidoreductase-F iron-sulfur binding region domain-containing protein [Limnochordia bacterium]|jgi:NADH-quinone oxidoreductase subunit F
MRTLMSKCCDRCTHSKENPCRDFIRCRLEGPLCHDDADCKAKRVEIKAVLDGLALIRPVVTVGMGTCGLASGADKVWAKLHELTEASGLDVEFKQVGCIGLCHREVIVDIQKPNRPRVSFGSVTEDKVKHLVEYLENDVIPTEMVIGRFPYMGEEQEGLKEYELPLIYDLTVLKKQKRVALANCGLINPDSLDEYVNRGGFVALSKALGEMSPADVIGTVTASGLRGRGGGGFPTGRKWGFAAAETADKKYLVCNADEGDPGAFMDRSLLEGDPYRVLEGILIGAYAMGASEGYIYVRAEYPLAIQKLKNSLARMEELALIGDNILGSGFNFHLKIKTGAGAFVCGEETALLASIEGKRGMPRPRPPYPASKGLWGKPTCINNVETFANVPTILSKGADWFASIGTEKSKGTKVFALTGKINNTGLIEVPMGTSIREIVFDIGGGIINGGEYKAVQIGGPSGGCLPKELLDTPVDYESLIKAGAMMGSGGLVVVDHHTCMVDFARFFISFTCNESCGKCIPCREGTARMKETMDRIVSARADETEDDTLLRFQSVVELEKLAETIKDTAACGLCQTAPNPVLSTLRYFRDEYDAHVFERRCPAGQCRSLLTYTIEADKCRGCGLCAKRCPQNAIVGEKGHAHVIVEDKCIRCGACIQFCPFEAIKSS